MIRSVSPEDASTICDIYNYYVLNTHVNFEEEAVPLKEMESRIAAASDKHPWFVYEQDGRILGYAYASPWKLRSCYRYSVETTVYVAHGMGGKGIGSSLYETLFEALGKQDVHATIGGIALPNEASISLHEKFGMEKVAHFKQVGFKLGRWIDVAYYERILAK